MPQLRLAVTAPSANHEQLSSIKNCLLTAMRCFGDAWSLVDSAQANLICIWVDQDKDVKALQILQEKYPQERIIAFVNNKFPVRHRWCLAFAKNSLLPSTLSVVNLLSRVYGHFFPDDVNVAPSYFDPHQHLYGVIKQALDDHIARICSYPSCPDLYLLPKENCFYISAPIDQLIPMALAHREAIDIKQVGEQQIYDAVSYVKFSSRLSNYLFLDEDHVFQNINVKRYKRYSLNELRWFAMLLASQGRLLEGSISYTTPVLLKQFPEYLRLDYYLKEYKELADCMNSAMLTLPQISAKTGKSLFEAAALYNACAALNLIEVGDSAEQIIHDKSAARQMLETAFTSIGKTLKGRIKLVIAGSVGSGKTTAIATLSDFSPITTETRPSDAVSEKKTTTTVAMDYGEIRFHDELKMFLYGTPGQKRFDFMSQLLCKNAWGILLLIDNSETDPLAELDYYLKLFSAQKIRMVIGVTHYDISGKPDLNAYAEYLERHNLAFPIMQVDTRNPLSLGNLLANLAGCS